MLDVVMKNLVLMNFGSMSNDDLMLTIVKYGRDVVELKIFGSKTKINRNGVEKGILCKRCFKNNTFVYITTPSIPKISGVALV